MNAGTLARAARSACTTFHPSVHTLPLLPLLPGLGCPAPVGWAPHQRAGAAAAPPVSALWASPFPSPSPLMASSSPLYWVPPPLRDVGLPPAGAPVLPLGEGEGSTVLELDLDGEGVAPAMHAATKRTYQPSAISRRRRHGFLIRNSSTSGRALLTRRRMKGRHRVSV